MKTEELTNKALTLIDKILDAANAGIEQAPAVIQDLAKEYVTYYFIENISNLTFYSALTVGCGVSIWFALRKTGIIEKDSDNYTYSDSAEFVPVFF